MVATRARPEVDAQARNDPAVEAAFRAVPETMVAEIIDGELHAMPRPARRHTEAASVLGGELHGPFRRGQGGPGGWVILDEPEIHLGPKPDKVVPELAGWRRERMPDELGAADAPPYYDVTPDWVCEILAPGTEATDRGTKMRIYRREAVAHAWLINPTTCTLEVYRLETGRSEPPRHLRGGRAGAGRTLRCHRAPARSLVGAVTCAPASMSAST